jgi:hypothetical protein
MILQYMREKWSDWVVRIVALALLYVAPWEGVGKILLVVSFVALDRILSARAARRRRAGERLLDWRVAKYETPAPMASQIRIEPTAFDVPTSFANDPQPSA